MLRTHRYQPDRRHFFIVNDQTVELEIHSNTLTDPTQRWP